MLVFLGLFKDGCIAPSILALLCERPMLKNLVK